jgi:hypothetical protein
VTRVMKLHAQHGTVRWPIEVVLSDRELVSAMFGVTLASTWPPD